MYVLLMKKKYVHNIAKIYIFIFIYSRFFFLVPSDGIIITDYRSLWTPEIPEALQGRCRPNFESPQKLWLPYNRNTIALESNIIWLSIVSYPICPDCMVEVFTQSGCSKLWTKKKTTAMPYLSRFILFRICDSASLL